VAIQKLGTNIMKTLRVRLIIEGKVQGVWFRESARRMAVALGVNGWIKNNYDGSVEAIIDGEEHKVREMIAWCHEGPPAANVTKVTKTEEDHIESFSSFSIYS